MLRTARWTVLGAILTVALAGAAMVAPAIAAGPRLVARMTEPFLVGDHLCQPGTVTLRAGTAYYPGSTIDELWMGTDFLGFWVADGKRNESRSGRDSLVFERNRAGRLVLVGYVLRGDRADTAFRYRGTSFGSSRDAIASLTRGDVGVASR